LPNDSPTFAFCCATPDPLLLPELERVLKARDANGAFGTNGLRYGRVILIIIRIEHMRLKAAARAFIEPNYFGRADQTCCHA
jgi:hypothetical protein